MTGDCHGEFPYFKLSDYENMLYRFQTLHLSWSGGISSTITTVKTEQFHHGFIESELTELAG